MTESLNLMGNVDPEDIPNDPFYVAPGTYDCIVTDARIQTKDDGTTSLVLRYTIDDDSEFSGNSVKEWKTIFPDLTEDEMTPDIRKELSRLKQRLLSLGVPESEMSKLDPEDLKGIECKVTFTENVSSKDPTRKFTNVTFVKVKE